MTAPTTMSTVRQRLPEAVVPGVAVAGSVLVVVMTVPPGGYQEKTHAMPRPDVVDGMARREWKTELPALALPRSGSRVCGRGRTLSAVRSPVRVAVVPTTVAPPGGADVTTVIAVICRYRQIVGSRSRWPDRCSVSGRPRRYRVPA